MEKGILTKAIESKFGTALDELIKLPVILEAVDGTAFKLAISGLDNYLGEKIPDPFKTEIRTLLVSVVEEDDYETAVVQAFEFLDKVVDVPGIDDEMEALIFGGMAQIVVGVIVAIKNKNVASDNA